MPTKLTLTLIAITVFVGCAWWPPSRLSANWGSAKRDVFQAQITSPEGTPPDHDPGENVDGTTIGTAVGNYRVEQRRRAPEPGPVINIGTVGP